MADELIKRDTVLYNDSTPFNDQKLQTLSDIFSAIRHKMNGKDVRAPMAQMGEALIKLIQETGGNQSAEVKVARGDFDLLGSREDAQDRALKGYNLKLEAKADTSYIANYLSKISYVPETLASLDALKTKYPIGKNGLFITADTGHKYIWNNNIWQDAGIYQAVGIADNSVSGDIITDNTLAAGKLEDIFLQSLVKLQNQTPMNLSTSSFSRPAADSVNGYIYIQGEPLLGSGPLNFSVIASQAGSYEFFTFEKIYNGTSDQTKMRIIGADTVVLTAGLNKFQSTLTANGAVTYYGMKINNGTPMQRLDKEYPYALASSAVVGGNIDEEILVHELYNSETEGFFAEVKDQIDIKSINKIAKQTSEFLINGISTTYSDNESSIELKPTKRVSSEGLQQVDPDAFTFWGVRLANQDLYFNGFNIRIKLSSLDYRSQKYRYCGMVKNLKTDEIFYSYSDIDPKIDYSQQQNICFGFNQSFNLVDDIVIGISIVDLNNQVQSVGSTGAIFTDGLDDNLFNDGTDQLKHAIYYSNNKGDVSEVSWSIGIGDSNKKPYYGLFYQLLSGTIKQNYSIFDVKGKTKKFVIPNYNTLRFRPAQPNFASNSNAYFLGRWFKTDAGVMTINQGAEVDARFSGTSIAADVNALATLPCLAYSIDGQPFKRVQMTQNGVTSLATGLDSGSHYVRLIMDGVKENDDLWVGHKGIVFNQFIVNNDRTIKTTPIRPVNKVGWFIGDSITAGINVLGNGANPTVNSATGAYSFIASNDLNLTNVRIAFGATGITKGGSGGVPAVSSYLDYAVSGVAEQVQDYPDLIVINHGTNDASAAAADFVAKYRDFLRQINIKMPGTPIFVIVPFNGVFADNFKDIINGYPNVNLVDTTDWSIAGPNTGHPDAANSKVAGLKLAAELRSVLGDDFFNN